MNIRPIPTKTDHQEALARVSTLMALDPVPGTPESDELEVLAQMVENYEKKAYDLGLPGPVDLIIFAMEQRGLTSRDMVAFLGSASRVSEVLGGKRNLTLPMIAKLHRGLGLPIEPLVLGTVGMVGTVQRASRHQTQPLKRRAAAPPRKRGRKAVSA